MHEEVCMTDVRYKSERASKVQQGNAQTFYVFMYVIMAEDIKNLCALGFKGVFFSNRKCLALNKTTVYTGLSTNEKRNGRERGRANEGLWQKYFVNSRQVRLNSLL